MNRLIRAAAVAGAIVLSLAAVATTSAREDHDEALRRSRLRHNNTAGVNSVSGFDRHADGTLTPIPGSPFSIGGAGTGAPVGSQGALQFSADGDFLLAVDVGSNQVSVAEVRRDGSLRPGRQRTGVVRRHHAVSIAA